MPAIASSITTRSGSGAGVEAKLEHHEECHGQVHGPIDSVFAWLDGHSRLSAHMERRSWRMGWGRMAVHADAHEGRSIGSRIRIHGRILGIQLSVDEEVSERAPPTRKVWETVGAPRLLVIGRYRMGFALSESTGSEVAISVFIDYALPRRGVSRLLGRLLGRRYARWCTARMVSDAVTVFGAPADATEMGR